MALVTKPIRQLDQQLYPLFGLLSIERHLGRGEREREGREKRDGHKEAVPTEKKVNEGGETERWETVRRLMDTIACSVTQ